MPVNTAALKTFAPAMRRQLIEAVGRKLDLLLTRSLRKKHRRKHVSPRQKLISR